MWRWLVACGGEEPTDKGDDCRVEIPYDGVDQDCDGEDLRDVDGDGVPYPDDCRDDDGAIAPGAEEVAYDGVDQDCAAGDLVDVDGDGEPAVEVGGGDCDDGDDAIHGGADDDVGDDVDQDCDGTDGVDRDGDGAADRPSGGDDCDDRDPTRSPTLEETWYDGLDADCGGDCDHDQDGDGAVAPGTVVTDGDACDQEPGRGVYAPEDCADTNPAVVQIGLTNRSPRPGSEGVSLYTSVAAYFTADDPDAVLAVVANGLPVAGTVTNDDDGRIVFFTPDEPLLPETLYEVTLVYACGASFWTFTTGPEGGGGALDGLSWAFDLDGATFVEPAGFAPLVSLFGLLPLRLDLLRSDAANADVRFGFGDPQDTCVPTVDVEDAAWSDPILTVDSPSLLFVLDVPIPFEDAHLEAELRADGGTMTTLSGRVDTRPLVDLLGPGGPPEAVCDLLSAFAVACTPCPDGELLCLDFVVEDADAAIASPTLDVVTQADVDADPTCP